MIGRVRLGVEGQELAGGADLLAQAGSHESVAEIVDHDQVVAGEFPLDLLEENLLGADVKGVSSRYWISKTLRSGSGSTKRCLRTVGRSGVRMDSKRTLAGACRG